MLDLLIKNGTNVDGTDKPSYKGDLTIADGKIVGIVPEINEAATKVIEAEGMIVAPGFLFYCEQRKITKKIKKSHIEWKFWYTIPVKIIIKKRKTKCS